MVRLWPLAVLLLLPMSPGLAQQPPAETPPTKLASVRIESVPHIQQRPDFCGEACAAMALAKLGYKIDQDDVFDQAGLDPVLGRGCYTKELRAALVRIGFDVGPVWHQASASHAEAEMEIQFRALHTDLAAGVPSIVCMHYDDQPETTEHFRLIVGYDAAKEEVLFHEPAVSINSEVGLGTKVTIYLPRSHAALPASSPEH